MNLKHLSDQELITKTKDAVRHEKEATAVVLHHIREVERRKAYGIHSSLFVICRKDLGYSESETHRRIAAAKLVEEIPEVEEKLEQGALSLTSIGQAQTFFRHNSKTMEEKREILASLENKSTRETDKILAGLAPESPRKETSRAVTATETELRFTVDETLLKDLEKLKGLLAHQLQEGSYRELLRKLADLALAKVDPARKKGKDSPQHAARKVVPSAIRRKVWQRDGGRCQYRESNKQCESRHGLQLDHVKPRALGGKHDQENLRLLCWHHHRRVTEEAFGDSS